RLLQFTAFTQLGIFGRCVAWAIGVVRVFAGFGRCATWRLGGLSHFLSVVPAWLSGWLGRFGGRFLSPTIFTTDWRAEGFLSHLEVDLALVEIDAHDPHFNGVAQTEATASALARQ